MIYLYTYETTYQSKTVEEVYQIEADSKEGADYEMSFGCGDLITEHKEDLGRAKSMKLLKVEEK